MTITIGIKLPVGEVSAKAAMSLKKSTGLSLAEITSRAINDEYLIECSVADDEGLRVMNGMRKDMAELGIAMRQFEGGREEPAELFDNLEQLNAQIDAEYD
jgi:hypothetical protein